MRLPHALGPVLVGLLIAATTAASTTAAQPMVHAAFVQPLTPVTLSPVPGGAEAATREPIGEPGAASPVLAAILADGGSLPVPALARRSQPEPAPRAVVKAAPRRYTAGTSHVLRGSASWFCNGNPSRGPISSCDDGYPDTGGFDAYAAAGPRLRAALGGGWRGRVVSVDGLRLKLVDWCQCYQGQSNEKVIDVYRDVYLVVGGSVTIRW